MELKSGDIIWSSTAYHRDKIMSYNIIFDRYASNGGCWCPPEAIDFFISMGIKVYKTGSYDSGLAAPGCTWNGSDRPMSKHVAIAYKEFFVPVTNRDALQLLFKR